MRRREQRRLRPCHNFPTQHEPLQSTIHVPTEHRPHALTSFAIDVLPHVRSAIILPSAPPVQLNPESVREVVLSQYFSPFPVLSRGDKQLHQFVFEFGVLFAPVASVRRHIRRELSDYVFTLIQHLFESLVVVDAGRSFWS